MPLEHIFASPPRRRLISGEAGARPISFSNRAARSGIPTVSLRDIKTRLAQTALAFDVSLAPFEGYSLDAPEAASFLWERPALMQLLPAIQAQLEHFFPLAPLRLEKSEPREIGEKPQVVIVCVTSLDALAAFEARRAFLNDYWLQLSPEVRAELGFHLEFAAE